MTSIATSRKTIVAPTGLRALMMMATEDDGAIPPACAGLKDRAVRATAGRAKRATIAGPETTPIAARGTNGVAVAEMRDGVMRDGVMRDAARRVDVVRGEGKAVGVTTVVVTTARDSVSDVALGVTAHKDCAVNDAGGTVGRAALPATNEVDGTKIAAPVRADSDIAVIIAAARTVGRIAVSAATAVRWGARWLVAWAVPVRER